MRINQRTLHERVAADSKMPIEVVKHVLESYQDVVVRALAEGDSVMQTNFVTFNPVDREARRARNPQTGERVTVPAKKAVKVKVTVLPRVAELVDAGISKLDGQPVTLRKLTKGSKGIVPVSTANPNASGLRVWVAAESRSKSRKTPRKGR